MHSSFVQLVYRVTGYHTSHLNEKRPKSGMLLQVFMSQITTLTYWNNHIKNIHY